MTLAERILPATDVTQIGNQSGDFKLLAETGTGTTDDRAKRNGWRYS
jgi:hypothetical protein